MIDTLPRTVFAALVTNLVVIASVIASGKHDIHAENALFENIQAVCLIFAAILYAASSLRNRSTERVEFVGLALLCFSFSLREIDFELIGLPRLIEQLLIGNGRTASLLVLWSGYLAFLLRQPVNLSELIHRQFDSGLSRYLFVSAGLLLTGALIDRGLFTPDHPRLFEELLEVNAYALLVIPAAKSIVTSVRKPQDNSIDAHESDSVTAAD
jgi:hypothetical protein